MKDDPQPTAATGATGAPTGTPLPKRSTALPDFGPRYAAIRLIESGGTSEVYRVTDRLLARDCALKLFTSDLVQPEVEAQLAASLRHPAIVPVHDFGRLADGRHWLVMQLVEGASLRAILDARAPGRQRLLDHLLRVAQAVAYAHGEGVVHRDLKPDNVYVDTNGAVFVLDWGIAEKIGLPGTRIGTEGYMAPEQAAGAISRETMDVYALGRLLQRILDMRGPDDRSVTALRALAARCTDPSPAARPANAGSVVAALTAWFDGVQRQQEAEGLIAQADETLEAARTAWAAAEQLHEEAGQLLDALPAFATADLKAEGWAAQDAASAREADARRLEVQAEQLLQEALRRVDDLPAAVERLSTLAFDVLRRARRTGNTIRAADARDRLLVLDAPIARQLTQRQAVRIHTDPAGAEVFLSTFEVHNRRRVPGPETRVGRTPIEVRLEPGSHRLRLVAEGRPPVLLPVWIDWAHPVDWVPPGSQAPCVIPLPERLGPNERYVPPGWCIVGGDDQVSDSLPGRWVWVDGFVIEAEPLTCGALVAGLNAMLEAGETALAEVVGRVPDEDGDGVTQLTRLADGRFAYAVTGDFDVSAWPATKLDWNAARGWAEWRRRQTGEGWRLPDEIEWEKAARGADGRTLPWGDHFEPTWACVVGSRPGDPRRGPASEWPTDESVYGVRGMAGNVRTWCRNVWTRKGECTEPRLTIGPLASDAELRILRGGFYLASTRLSRPAGRYASKASKAWGSAGIRLVRPIRG